MIDATEIQKETNHIAHLTTLSKNVAKTRVCDDLTTLRKQFTEAGISHTKSTRGSTSVALHIILHLPTTPL